jgi:hypothetical protein
MDKPQSIIDLEKELNIGEATVLEFEDNRSWKSNKEIIKKIKDLVK